MKLKTNVSEQIEQFVADHDGLVTVAQISAYYGIREDFARRVGRELGAKKYGYAIVFNLAQALELAKAVREHNCTALKPRNVDQAVAAYRRENSTVLLFPATANGRAASLLDMTEEPQDRYQLRLGKWGVYVRDCHADRDLPLSEVVQLLNHPLTAEARSDEAAE